MKRLISIAVSGGILLVIYWKIDFAGLIQVFRGCGRGRSWVMVVITQ